MLHADTNNSLKKNLNDLTPKLLFPGNYWNQK